MGRSLLLLAGVLSISAASARIIVFRGEKGIQFAEGEVLLVNGKDSVRVLGPAASFGGDARKLLARKLADVRTIIRDEQSKTPAAVEDGKLSYLYPDGLKQGGTPVDAWSKVAIAYRQNKSEKTAATINPAQLIAILPDTADALPEFCLNAAIINLLTPQGRGLETQIALITAASQAYADTNGMPAVRSAIENAMRSGLQRYDSGFADVAALGKALEFAHISEKVYPSDGQQQKLRSELLERKMALETRLAVLHALRDGEQWDSFLWAYRDFIKYEHNFPEMMKSHDDVLSASVDEHARAGVARMENKEFKAALVEFRKALARDPNNADLQSRTRGAWAEYSQEQAEKNRSKIAPLGTAEKSQITRYLEFADRHLAAMRLGDALASVEAAEKVSKDSVQVLLKKAEVLAKRNELVAALETLDRVDLIATAEDAQRAQDQRNAVEFQLNSLKSLQKKEIQALIDQGSYNKARALSLQAVLADRNDSEFLYFSAFTSLAVRRREEGMQYLNRFLETSDRKGVDRNLRRNAYQLREKIGASTDRKTSGQPNWLSGRPLGPNVFYCPSSLAFQPRMEKISVGKKLSYHFRWYGSQLRSIVPVWDKGVELSPANSIYFDYDSWLPHAMAASTDSFEYSKRPPARPESALFKTKNNAETADIDAVLRASTLLYSTNPFLDPVMIQLLTGHTAAIGVAGNRFFNPFVWDKPTYFQLMYDSAERVVGARQIPVRGDPPGALVEIEFAWDGDQLTGIAGYEVSGEQRGPRIYQRTLHYSAGKLMSETISGRAATSAKIEYKYNGDRLVSAVCTDDPTLAAKARTVMFQ